MICLCLLEMQYLGPIFAYSDFMYQSSYFFPQTKVANLGLEKIRKKMLLLRLPTE